MSSKITISRPPQSIKQKEQADAYVLYSERPKSCTPIRESVNGYVDTRPFHGSG